MTRLTAALLGVLLTLTSACGGENARAETQPAPNISSFTAGDFEDLPKPPRFEPAGKRSEIDGVVTRSFFGSGTTPEQVLEFYRNTFAGSGVTMTMEPARVGRGWRGRWMTDDRELLVSATVAPGAGAEDERPTQLSLELSPVGGGGHGGDSDARD
jgi:hypothetical protein